MILYQQVKGWPVHPPGKSGHLRTSQQADVMKRTIKDSVFTNLFQDKKYLLQLYKALHPEDTDITEDKLTDITIKNVLKMKRDALCRATEGNDVLQSNMEKPIWENDADIIGRLCRGY